MKIKISFYALIISSLVTFACTLKAVNGSANQPENQKQTVEPKDLTVAESNLLPAAQKDAGTHFKGFINRAKFEMTLQRAGNELSGSYFYIKSGSGNALTLRGKIDSDGKFTMQEFDASGKQTGEFKGVWKDDPNESGASLEGEWKKPNAKEGISFQASEQVFMFSGGTQIISKQIAESIKAKRFDVTAEYPELIGGANAAGFNQTVKTRVEKVIGEFKKEMVAATAEDLKMLPEGVNNYIEINYDVDYADNDFISVNFLESTFGGGVHPNYNYFTINYDLKNSKELKLAGLFKPGAKYLETVSAYAIKDLQSRKSPDGNENAGLAQDVFKEGALPKTENYQNWNITKKGLMFTFEPYQVASYADGTQYVIVPYAKLKDIAKPDSAVAKFMK